MQTETRDSMEFDLADMIIGLPPAIAGSLSGTSGSIPRQNRRLPERILVAAHQACDLGDLDVATQLLSILETVVSQTKGPVDPGRRRVMESLIAAYQRIWHLRYSDEAASAVAASTVAARGIVAPLHGFHEAFDMAGFQPAS